MQFSKILINWYLSNKRDLPWRKKSDPYHIWLSEIMLQQTRVEQGLPYYQKFIEAFPDVYALAKAPAEKVLKLWQGLGYYSRARNLHETAKIVAFELKGNFPDNYANLKKLKGVGDYTASAIASIAFNQPVAVVDGNVYRVLSRYFNIDTPINSTLGIREFKILADQLLDAEKPSLFNQGLMEFGALQCKPRNPLCETCPFNGSCLAFKEKRIHELPVKLKRGRIKKRYFNYLVVSSEENETLLQQRKGKGIWEGLYEFPLIETPEPVDTEKNLSKEKVAEVLGNGPLEISLYNDVPVVHKLSHQHIFTHFWRIHTKNLNEGGIPLDQVKEYPVPVLIQNFLAESGLENY